MGMYCACEIKMSGHPDGKHGCTCDWEGWVSTCDWPEERKNKETPIQRYPKEPGVYLTRCHNGNFEQLHETEHLFSSGCWLFEALIDEDDLEPWEREIPYAWKPIKW